MKHFKRHKKRGVAGYQPNERQLKKLNISIIPQGVEFEEIEIAERPENLTNTVKAIAGDNAAVLAVVDIYERYIDKLEKEKQQLWHHIDYLQQDLDRTLYELGEVPF